MTLSRAFRFVCTRGKFALPVVAASAVAASVFAAAACAEDLAQPTALAQPKGEVILTVTGNIEKTNDGDSAKFDREMLESIGMTTITTSSPWYDTKMDFEGVSFKKLMELVGAKGDTIHAFALNDYDTEIPMSDLNDTGVILAMKLNGEIMKIRDKGPIFVIYPYDSASPYQAQTYYARSAWQVTRIAVE